MKKGKEKGLKKEVRGLWTDIVASPYYSFGVDCETPNKFAEGLFEIYNKVLIESNRIELNRIELNWIELN